MQQACDDDISPRICQDDFHFYDDLPAYAEVVVSVDPGHCREPGGSYSAVVAWGVVGNDYYLIDAARGHFNTKVLCDTIKAVARRAKAGTILIEETGFGREAIPRLKPHFEVVAITQPSQSKVDRALRHVDLFKKGHVYVPRFSAHVEPLIEELVRIGHAPSSDLADATTQFLSWHRQHPQPEIVGPKPRLASVGMSTAQARALPPSEPSRAGAVAFARTNPFGLGEPRTRDEKLNASLFGGGPRGRL
jgi:phage terminase large subunit-like protein